MAELSLTNAKSITIIDNTHGSEERIYELPTADGENGIDVNCKGARMVVTYGSYKENDGR